MNGYEWKEKAFGVSSSAERCSTLFSRVARDVVFIDCDNSDLIEYYPKRLVPWGLFERLEWLYDFLDKIIMVDPSCVVACCPEKLFVLNGEKKPCMVVLVNSDIFLKGGSL